MARPRKVKEQVEIEEATVMVETAPEPTFTEPEEVVEVVETPAINIKHLKTLVWNTKLEDMQDAVAGIKGDAGTMNAVDAVLKATSAGIASQYLQQIIQRNS